MAKKAQRSTTRTPKKPAKGKAGSPAKPKPKPAKKSAASKAAPIPRTRLPLFQVDAFTSRAFHGNPAGVMLLEAWISDDHMQLIAAENNLAETAFFTPKGDKKGVPQFHLRWFTPTLEMDLCGHATLASAHVLWNHVGIKGNAVAFHTRSGVLGVTREDDGGGGELITLDFPARPGQRVKVTDAMCAACGHEPSEAYLARDLMLVFENRRAVYDMTPDFRKIAELEGFGVIVTAPGSAHDFVSRFFAPKAGVPEDPVTGSAHCTLAPYWAARYKKTTLAAHQVSRRGGELRCEVTKDRVKISGHAVTFFQGVCEF